MKYEKKWNKAKQKNEEKILQKYFFCSKQRFKRREGNFLHIRKNSEGAFCSLLQL